MKNIKICNNKQKGKSSSFWYTYTVGTHRIYLYFLSLQFNSFIQPRPKSSQASTNPIIHNFSRMGIQGRRRSSRRGRWGRRRWRLEWFLLRAAEDLVGSGFFPADAHEVEVMQVMGDGIVHGVNFTLATGRIAIEDVDGGAKARDSLGERVVLGGFPFTYEHIMGWGQVLLRWGHPPPNCSLKCYSRIVFNVLWVVQQINFQGLACLSIVVVPVMGKATTFTPHSFHQASNYKFSL